MSSATKATVEMSDQLAPVPDAPQRSLVSRIKRGVSALRTRDAWLGDVDYRALFVPSIPGLTKNRDLPFYGVDAKLPIVLAVILGLQHALAMVGGVVTPPLLLGGVTGANLGTESTQYLVSASLIWCAFGTALQVSRSKIFKTKYYIGTGIISVTGTSFAFVNVGLSFLGQAYRDGTCQLAEDGTKLPCPEAFGAILGTACLTGLIAIAMAFIPPKVIRRLFPPVIVGMMLALIGATLVKSGVTNWAGGSSKCMTDHTVMCPSNTAPHPQPWGSAPLIGLGFTCFATIILCELVGSPFIKSASVFIGLVVGMIVAAATGYFDGSKISSAPAGAFLWTKTFPLSLRGELVLPMIAAWVVIVAETIGNVTASCDVSRIPIEGSDFEARVQGGMLADGISASLAGLAMVPPLTTFSQNSGVIALTRNASRQAGFICAAFLFLMGVIGKFVALFVAMPASTLGGFTTFLFASVAISGIRVMAYANWDRRTRFIATCGFSLGLASLCVPTWFNYFFTYSGDNKGLKGLIQAIVLIVEEPYLIASLIAIFLNATIPHQNEDENEVDERTAFVQGSSRTSSDNSDIEKGSPDVQQEIIPQLSSRPTTETWNEPGPVLGRR